MRCDEVQDLASAWLDHELSDARAHDVAEHEAGCEACRAYVKDLRQLSEQLTSLGREPAPPGLEERVRAALAEEREARGDSVIPSRRWLPAWHGTIQQLASLAAVCVLSVFGTWAVMHRSDQTADVEHDVVAAHVRSLLQDSIVQVVSSDQHTVRPWFNGKVEFAPPVKDLAAEGFPLVGGRLDYVNGHRVATLVYRHGPHTISVFVWPETAHTPAPAPLTQVEGLNVFSWTKDGMVWWAVSDMEPAELRELRALL